MPFSMVLAYNKMQRVATRIWTRVADSISYNNKSYTTHTSYKIGYNILILIYKRKERK